MTKMMYLWDIPKRLVYKVVGLYGIAKHTQFGIFVSQYLGIIKYVFTLYHLCYTKL